MPEKRTLERARRDKREGKAPSTQAGEFVREEMHHVREGKHGAKSTQQAIAIGLSKARRAGVPLKARKGKTRAKRRSGRGAASHEALSQQAKSAARARGPRKRREAAKKAARTRAKRAA